MFRAIEVENYRSFVKPARIELRPITILLGKNSAGKSSLTRLFPLLQQSVGRDTSAPVLWTSNTVDFGRISDVINRRNAKDGLKIGFEIVIPDLGRWRATYRTVPRMHSIENESCTIKYRAHMDEGEDGKTRFKGISLSIDDDEMQVAIANEEISAIIINGKKIDTKPFWKSSNLTVRRMFPFMLFSNDREKGEISEIPNTSNRMAVLVRNFIQGSDFKENRNRLIASQGLLRPSGPEPYLPFVPRNVLGNYLRTQPGFISGSLENTAAFNELADLILLTYLPWITESVGAELTPIFESTSYLGPIRASVSRFYREQELSVDRIDEKGENLATYLGALSPNDLESFNALIRVPFGIEVRPHPYTGHLSIEVGSQSTGDYDNLADVGFGFSQLLPLVAQIHNNLRGRRGPTRAAQHLIAVEQPELHLHPAFQANLADLFLTTALSNRHKANGSRATILLETHSEAIIARFGELVASKIISANDIAIYFVDKDPVTSESTVRLANYTDEGYVSGWPLGFFSAR